MSILFLGPLARADSSFPPYKFLFSTLPERSLYPRYLYPPLLKTPPFHPGQCKEGGSPYLIPVLARSGVHHCPTFPFSFHPSSGSYSAVWFPQWAPLFITPLNFFWSYFTSPLSSLTSPNWIDVVVAFTPGLISELPFPSFVSATPLHFPSHFTSTSCILRTIQMVQGPTVTYLSTLSPY